MKKYSIIVLVAMLIVLIPTVSAETSASASRSIESSNLAAGESTNVTVIIVNGVSPQGLALKETVPSGWIVTNISEDGGIFKSSTNEWAWVGNFSFGENVTKTVIYNLKVPSNAASGNYNINGDIINASGIIANVTGDDLIVVSAPTITITPTPTATETVTVTPTIPSGVPVPEYPVSSSLVLSIAGIMLVALMLMIQNKKGE